MNRHLKLIRRVLLCALLSANAHAAPKVAVSVLPVHSLVSAVLGEMGEAQLLIPGGQSPHASRLKPSQVGALFEAELIIWVGAPLEQALAKLIGGRDGATTIITLLDAPEINVLRPPDDEHTDGHGHEHGDGNGNDDWRVDPHLWLSFANARAIVTIAARELSRLDAANRDRYAANARAVLARMDALRSAMRAQLREMTVPETAARYVVFHDAYRYFEAEFNVHPLAALTVNVDRALGAKRIREVRRLIKTQNVRCVFREPQFQPALVNTLVADTAAKVGVLDPLGATLTAGADAWFEMMRELADALTECVTPA